MEVLVGRLLFIEVCLNGLIQRYEFPVISLEKLKTREHVFKQMFKNGTMYPLSQVS